MGRALIRGFVFGLFVFGLTFLFGLIPWLRPGVEALEGAGNRLMGKVSRLRSDKTAHVMIVDISAIPHRDEKGRPANRARLAKLLKTIAAMEPKAIAIDRDFSIGDETTTDERAFLNTAADLNEKIPIVLGVAENVDLEDLSLVFGYPVGHSEQAQRYGSMSATMYIDREAPRRYTVRIRRSRAPGDELSGLASKLVGPVKRKLVTSTTWVETGGHFVEHGMVHQWVNTDLSLIGSLPFAKARPDGSIDWPKLPNHGTQINPNDRVAFDKYIVLADIHSAEPHDNFDVSGIGDHLPGGEIHAAAAASILEGDVLELTRTGNLIIDGVVSCLIAVIVALVRDVRHRRLGKHEGHEMVGRVEFAWTLTFIAAAMLIASLVAIFGGVVWYGVLEFSLAQLIAYPLSLFLHRNLPDVKKTRPWLLYLYLGDDRPTPGASA